MRRAWRWLADIFTPAERDPADDPDQEMDAEHVARLARDRFAFADEKAWLRFRAKHGYSTRRRLGDPWVHRRHR